MQESVGILTLFKPWVHRFKSRDMDPTDQINDRYNVMAATSQPTQHHRQSIVPDQQFNSDKITFKNGARTPFDRMHDSVLDKPISIAIPPRMRFGGIHPLPTSVTAPLLGRIRPKFSMVASSSF